MKRFPGYKFIFFGDTGEQDPELYGECARVNPAQVAGIYIRNVTDESRDNPRMTRAFRGLPGGRWRLFKDAGEVASGNNSTDTHQLIVDRAAVIEEMFIRFCFYDRRLQAGRTGCQGGVWEPRGDGLCARCSPEWLRLPGDACFRNPGACWSWSAPWTSYLK